MKRVSIIGYGVTTAPLVDFLNQQGIGCDIFDDKFNQSSQKGLNNFIPTKNFDTFRSNLEITSPGIPPYHTLIQNSKNLVSEYDFFDSLVSYDPISIWISGTNGKTTTTQMLEFLLQEKGAMSGGNIGYPLTNLYLQKPPIWILETSSFMLHYTKKAFPKLYILLPVREDHISWHQGFDGYLDAKLSPLLRMQEDGIALIPEELKEHPNCKKTQTKIVFYRSSAQIADLFGFNLKESVFKEPFLLDSLLALGGVKLLFGEVKLTALNNFQIGRHRIEEFFDSKKRLWVNDSKGTNVDATCEAIKRYQDKKILLILGGDDKGADQRPVFELIKHLDIKLFLIGSNAKRLEKLALEYNIGFENCFYLQDAVLKIKREREENDVVLLSPAAASLDQFDSYKHRGEVFKQLALQRD
ncbi:MULTISPECIES: UDP-N-acetylmuramoyl-L-alanine--D-glutamate ligase [unclassified Helicobacter]|uniref:UDP-N-acetylmuramoyl-L-alanine--D-glutamate ligase n=1 Tax=unclassified Helicobacter TaxID=2593540 RepID=UPI000CF0A0EA|nr:MULTISPECIES: UDP-N-acetylmuramoyl-L-alanine--D-glutamate ligase [unclassified Helicobacter]